MGEILSRIVCSLFVGMANVMLLPGHYELLRYLMFGNFDAPRETPHSSMNVMYPIPQRRLSNQNFGKYSHCKTFSTPNIGQNAIFLD